MFDSYSLNKKAEEDWRSIVQYTLDNFGVLQTEKYIAQLEICLENFMAPYGIYRSRIDGEHQILIKHC